MQVSAERHARIFLGLLVLGLAALVPLNAVLDPFLAYRVVEIEALRPYRDKLVSRIAKAELLERERCAVVILGSSRAQIALDPELAAWGAPACNLALTGVGMDELERVLAHVLQRPEPRELVIALDFTSFNRQNQPHEDFDRSRFNQALHPFEYHAGLLIGSDATRASLRLLSDLRAGRRAPYTERGLTDPALRGQTGDRKSFLWALERVLRSLDGARGFRYETDAPQALALSVRRAREQGVWVTLLILPTHALYYETLQRVGLWPTYERWLRELAAAFEPAGVPAIAPVWDFTAYADVTTEPVPEQDGRADMRWHWDVVHVKRALGEAVVARVRGDRAGGPGFGARLTRASVEPAIATLRRDRERYLATRAQLDVIDEAQGRVKIARAAPPA